jgi:hypothetical protein
MAGTSIRTRPSSRASRRGPAPRLCQCGVDGAVGAWNAESIRTRTGVVASISRRVVVTASATRRFPPRGEAHAPRRSRCATISGAAPAVVVVARQRVQAADLGVAEPGTLFVVAVDLDHGVVDIDRTRTA